MLSFFRDAKSKLQEQPFNFVFKYIFSPWFFPSSNYLLSDTAFNAWKLLSYQIWIKRIHHRNEMHFNLFPALQLVVCLNQIEIFPVWNSIEVMVSVFLSRPHQNVSLVPGFSSPASMFCLVMSSVPNLLFVGEHN